jgi:aldose 1-epimerase
MSPQTTSPSRADDAVVICDGVAEAVILPSVGAALSSYALIEGAAREPLFRSAPGNAREPFDLACNLLLPWSNRISGGGFRFGGRFHALAANVPGEPSPIHGNGFSSVWQLSEAAGESATLRLASEGPGPFRYAAEVRYALRDGALTINLTVTNRAAEPLPYGLGLHPWLPRTAKTTLHAPAHDVWLEDGRHLPTGRVPVRSRAAWDFGKPGPLPSGWINNGFAGWNGSATLAWLERELALIVEASQPISTYLLYSPGASANFFCFEPVSHLVDAHNICDRPEDGGLVVLVPDGMLTAQVRFCPRRL